MVIWMAYPTLSMNQKISVQESWPEEATFCWGCGKNNEHGLKLKSYWNEDETIATWEPKDHHLAFPGILNGGIIATLIDCHATGTANAAAHKSSKDELSHFMYVTASLSVKFLRPTPLHRPVTLKARVTDISDKRIAVYCELYSDDTLCATGEIVTARVDTDKFLKQVRHCNL